MLFIPAFSCALGTAMLRLGWQRRRGVVAAGWVLLVAGLIALGAQEGAWGLAVGALCATAAAAVVLGHAALVTPPSRTAPPRDATSASLPGPSLRDVGRRLGVFAAVVPGSLVVSALLSLAIYRTTRLALGETDATVFAIALLPVTWTLLASLQLMRQTLAAMLPPLVVVGALGALAWIRL